MITILFGLLIIIIKDAHLARTGELHADYMEPEATNAMKGVFVALVFLKHFSQYIDMSSGFDQPAMILFRHLGQMIVAMFLFYSGFGMMESVKKKGRGYLNSFLKRRLFRVWLHFALAIVLYLCVQLGMGTNLSLGQIGKAFVGWESIGNSNWYMFDIFVLYFLFWISFFLIELALGKPRYALSATLFTALVMAFVYLLMKAGKPSWFYNTCILFPLGIWYAQGRRIIERVLSYKGCYYLTAFLLACGYVVTFQTRSRFGIEGYTIWAVVFTLSVVVASMKCILRSELLQRLGAYTFELYILQRIPMMILQHCGFMTASMRYAALAISWFATWLMAWAFRWITTYVDRKMGMV